MVQLGLTLVRSTGNKRAVSIMDILETYLLKEIERKNISSNLGNKIVYLHEVDSTNKYALNNSQQFGNGSIIITDKQTNGRGRLNRKWESPEGKNLYLSILLKDPPFLPADSPSLNIMISLALAITFEKFGTAKPTIKWPNDILFDNKKIAGILIEGQFNEKKINKLAIGIGININSTKEEFSEEIRARSTSLYILQKTYIKRENFLEVFLHYLNLCYNNFIKKGLKNIKERWEEYFSWIGKEVNVINYDEVITGKVIGIDEKGLLVINIEGKETKIIAGDISIRRKDATGY